MENEIEIEFQCQICMDLMVEPVTTICGHTFCKICLIRYLKTKLNCPICRKTILQSPETLAKNISFENLIKSKYQKNYEERLNLVKLSNLDESISEKEIRRNIPTIYLDNTYVWPRVKRRLVIKNMIFYPTLLASSINNRFCLISPCDSNLNHDESNNISSLVEIESINRNENQIDLEVNGLKRFKINSMITTQMSDNNPLFLSTGEIVKDMEITSDEIIKDVRNKLRRIAELHHEILQSSSLSVQQQLERIYGKPPNVNNIMAEANMNTSQLECFSFYFLNIINNNEKKKFYETKNLVDRVNW